MENVPTILGMETSTDACSVALTHQGKIISRHEISPKEHVRIVLPAVESLLEECGISLSACDAIAFGCGPGSFTGLRIAAAVAQGLALGANLPLISVSSLEILAQTAKEKFSEALPPGSTILVMVDARIKEVYWGTYEVTETGLVKAQIADKLNAPTDIPQSLSTMVVGNAIEHYKNELEYFIPFSKDVFYPQADALVQIAIQDFIHKKFVTPEKALPVYLRDKVTQ